MSIPYQRNLEWLRNQVALKINFAPDDTDQDFAGKTNAPWYAIDAAINEAYRMEVAGLIRETSLDPFKRTFSFTWPVGTISTPLPISLKGKIILRFDDETSMVPGEPLWVMDREGMRDSALFWRDRETLQWGTQGPGETKTITAYYIEEAEEMTDPLDEPSLIPPRHRDLLIWEASCILREERDDTVPESWRARANRLRLELWSDFARGNPLTPYRPSIRDPYLGRM